MKKTFFIFLLLSMIVLLSSIAGCKKVEKQSEEPSRVVQPTQEDTGQNLFNKHCVMCHPDAERMRVVKTPDDIVNIMRNPKMGMPQFDKKEISDEDAKVIAKYIFLSILSKQ